MNKKIPWLVILVLVLAAGLRFYNPLFRSLWGDEVHTVLNIYNFPALGFSFHPVSLMQALRFALFDNFSNLLDNSHLPTYFVALSLWVNAFGIGEYALRAFSILIGIFSVWVFYVFTKRLFDEKTAWLGAFLLAISPLAIMHSQEIRMYGLLMCLGLLSSFYFWKLYKGERGWLNVIAYLIFSLLFIFTHIFAALLLLAQFLFLCLGFCSRQERANGWPILLYQLIIGCLAAPVYFVFISSKVAGFVGGAVDMAFSAFPWYLKLPLVFFVLSLGETVAPWNFWLVVPAGLVVGFLFLRAFQWVADRRILFLLVLTFIPILFSVLLLKPTMPKYLIICLPFYLLVLSYSLVNLSSRFWRMVLVAVLVFVQLVSIFNYFNLREYHNSNQIEPWRQVAGYLKKDYQPGDLIIASNNFVAYRMLGYYLNIAPGKDYPLVCLRNSAFIPPTHGWPVFKYEEQTGQITNIRNSRIWLITQMADDRLFPVGYIEAVRKQINTRYRLVFAKKFVPYEQTLVSRLPIKRHPAGSSRIEIDLYERK